MVGIPVAVLGVFWFLMGLVVQDLSNWPWMLTAFLAGYALQYWGHLVEGNTMGELIPVFRALGWKYHAIAPQFQTQRDEASVGTGL